MSSRESNSKDDHLPEMILEASKRIKPHVYKTPLMFSSHLSKLGQRSNVYIKLESEQITGSFKARGAFNKILSLAKDNPNVKKSGVYTASTGNHGLGCLLAAKTADVPLTIYCYEGVDPGKKEVLLSQGASIVLHGNDCVEAEGKARSDAKENGAIYISPYNDFTVMVGQGTIGIEIIEDLPTVDAVLVPVGGGGLIGGIARYIKQVKLSTKVYGCQPKNSKVMYESVKVGEIIFEESLPTLSDATAGGIEDNSVTFPVCRDYVDEWLMVEEETIAKAIVFMAEKHHKIVEGSAGVSIGAYMANSGLFEGQNVAIVSCGANIGIKTLQEVLTKYGNSNK